MKNDNDKTNKPCAGSDTEDDAIKRELIKGFWPSGICMLVLFIVGYPYTIKWLHAREITPEVAMWQSIYYWCLVVGLVASLLWGVYHFIKKHKEVWIASFMGVALLILMTGIQTGMTMLNIKFRNHVDARRAREAAAAAQAVAPAPETAAPSQPQNSETK